MGSVTAFALVAFFECFGEPATVVNPWVLGVVVGSGRLTTSVSWSFGFCSISHQHLDMSHNRLVKPTEGCVDRN